MDQVGKALVLAGLRAIRGRCDGANQQDGAGFGRYDVEFGHSLASKSELTDNQAVHGIKLCIKYGKQLPDVTLQAIKAIQIPSEYVAKSNATVPPCDFDVETLQWSATREISTRKGMQRIREAEIPAGSKFWDAWKTGYLKKKGYSVSKYGGVWKVVNWIESTVKLESETHHIEQDINMTVAEENLELDGVLNERLISIQDKLFPYQVPSVKRIIKAISKHNGAVDASQPGVGKTFSTIAACVVLDRPVFVVCPKAVIPSWKRAFEHFGFHKYQCINYELLRTGNTDFAIWKKEKNSKGENVEKFVWKLSKETIVVFDECHAMKSYTTVNAEMGIACFIAGYTMIGLSATLADNPMQMKVTGLIAKLYNDPKYFFAWMTQNGVKRGRFGMEFTGGKDCLLKINRQIFPEHGARIRIKDLGDQFPETQITAEAYDMNGNTAMIQQTYDEMYKEIAKIEASEKRDKQACILVEMLRARQKAEVLKIPALSRMAEDAIEEGLSVAIFLNFDDSMNAMCEKLKTACVIRGGQSPEERQNNIDAFQSDKERVIVCNIRAGGVGVSLHSPDSGNMRLALICPTFSGIDLLQCLGRVHRSGGTKSLQRIVFANGTIETQACSKVRAKINRINALNDGELSQALSF